MATLNIVELIENNPVTKLSNTYQNKLLIKIKNNFTDEEQQMFVASFYCYLNCNQKTEFVIDLDNVWKWLGFSNKDKAKRLLKNIFLLDNDYKCLLTLEGGQKTGRGGHNKETILMTVKAFKSFCLKAGTQKADQVHEYYLKLEDTLQEVIFEESEELKQQLLLKDEEVNKKINNAQTEKERIILQQFPKNTQCLYYGFVDNKSSQDEKLVKFGNSNSLFERVNQHKRTYTNFRLTNVFKVNNKILVENAIKSHPILGSLRRSIEIKDKTHNELLSIENLQLVQLDKIINDIILQFEYNPDNYQRLLEQNETITQRNILLEEENTKLKIDNVKLMKKYKLDKNLPDPDVELENNDAQYNTITNSLKRIDKSTIDGFYHIGNKSYKKYMGTREDVWNETAYKTTGHLTKDKLIVNKHGNIVSKCKFIAEKECYRLAEVNLKKKNPSIENLE
jgi:hypothetical protein